MGLFSNKPKQSIEELCRPYYDSQIFHAIFDGVDTTQRILDVAFDSIANEDPSFSKVDRKLFEKEMAGLHLELFALAWFHRFKKDEYIIPQSIFTHRYLKEIDRLDIWETMGEYNKAVAKTATLKANGQQMTGDTRYERATIGGINEARFELAEKWFKIYAKDASNPTKEEKEKLQCAGRAINRIGADLMRNNEIGNRRITALLLYRLGWKEDEDLNASALSKLAVQPIAMYEFAEKVLKTAEI